MSNRTVVYKPMPKWGHKGDSFREMIDLWEMDGLVTVMASPDRWCWWGKPGGVLLHDYDLLTDFPTPEHEFALYSNSRPEEPGNWDHWSFWPRRPRLMRKFLHSNTEVTPPHLRMFKSIFVGKVENPVQKENRFSADIDWSEHIQNYRVVDGVHTPYPYDASVYLRVMSKTKFAFLLPGYGPKCNRDIEACAVGCIPVVTPGVCTKYFNDWEEGVHFLRVKKESDIKKLDKVPVDKLQEIQNNVIEWYNQNSEPKAFFELTRGIIEKWQSSQKDSELIATG